ncbi:hypothetical protein Rsub_11115 [Raphidocelis subcapitata]|uniref:Uncharacterized protein n=1 Tax=Raphidocelis subcapitata TaxID=307507 RepID=A0A2V0PDS6_9CHLO|nr:hypothetical protein Rsub_11115 [Raphidocelis subcapitata]|eukprot:GBF98004.1 hypothetical protein Rsub_11115 [Raphidocelis subcapitata]
MRRGKNSGSDDEDWGAGEEAARSGGSNVTGGRARRASAAQARAAAANSSGRSRPTNNQLLYKAYFRWNHYTYKLRNGTQHLPTETDACASVTAAFLQVLHTLHVAESCRVADRRNILQILSNNTRRTKVVELSMGTHRVPDELRKHYLSDGGPGQYSTNLDRNRYGNDDQYLFTVIRYDLEYLGLCPCMIDVEIVDAKNDNQSIFVSAGPEACACHKVWTGAIGGAARPVPNQPFPMRPALPFPLAMQGLGMPLQLPGVVAPPAAAGAAAAAAGSPKRSGSGASHAFDALVMAATGGTEGAAAAGAGGEPPVDSLAARERGGGGTCPDAEAAAAALAAVAAARGAAGGGALRAQQGQGAKPRSRLFGAAGVSYGGADSLQNALDAFRAEEETASGLAPPSAGAGESLRRRQRKPGRAPSGGDGLLASLFQAGASGLREKSADNAADVSSGGDAAGGGDEADGGAAAGGASGDEEDDSQQQQHQAAAELVAAAAAAEAEAAAAAAGGGSGPARHVPRQSSAANLAARGGAGPADVKRLAADVEALRAENLRLSASLRARGVDPGAVAAVPAGGAGARLRVLERQLALLRGQIAEAAAGKRAAESEAERLTAELATTRAAANQVLSRLVAQCPAAGVAVAAAAGAGGGAAAAQVAAPFLAGGLGGGGGGGGGWGAEPASGAGAGAGSGSGSAGAGDARAPDQDQERAAAGAKRVQDAAAAAAAGDDAGRGKKRRVLDAADQAGLAAAPAAIAAAP